MARSSWTVIPAIRVAMSKVPYNAGRTESRQKAAEKLGMRGFRHSMGAMNFNNDSMISSGRIRKQPQRNFCASPSWLTTSSIRQRWRPGFYDYLDTCKQHKKIFWVETKRFSQKRLDSRIQWTTNSINRTIIICKTSCRLLRKIPSIGFLSRFFQLEHDVRTKQEVLYYILQFNYRVLRCPRPLGGYSVFFRPWQSVQQLRKENRDLSG